MATKTLYTLVKDRLLDEPSSNKQCELLNELVRLCLPKSDGGTEALPINIDFPDRLYSNGLLLPRAYCYIAFCLKVLEISTTGQRSRSITTRLWGYVLHNAMNAKEYKEFVKAIKADIAELRKQHGHLPQELADLEIGGNKPPKHPLKSVASTMLRAMIWDEDRDGMRQLVQWLYSSYEVYLRKLLNESFNVEQWLTNIAELIPRLLLKNLVPLHDFVDVRDPSINIVEYASPGTPHAWSDPGSVTQHSVFIRNLFTEKEIHALEQAGQRISELFAHAYPILLIEDHESELSSLHERVLDIARRVGRVRAIQHIEMQYRYNLRIPTGFYREIKNELLKM